MFTYHSVETCYTFRSYSSTFSYNDGNTSGLGYPEASSFTDTGASQSRQDHGSSFYSSMSKTENDGGSFFQTYWRAFGVKDPGSTSSTTFSQSWAVTSTLSTQSASQTSYTFSSRNSRTQATGTTTFPFDTSTYNSTFVSSYPSSSTSGSTTSTFQKTANGVTSVETSYTFSAPSTETYVSARTFSEFVAGSVYSEVVGTASATRTLTATRSLSASGKITAHLFGGALHAQILLNTRGTLPPLRPVSPALAATGAVTDPLMPLVTLSTSQFTWPKGLYSSWSTSSTSSSSLTTGAIRTTSHYTTSSFVGFSVTSFSSTNINLSVEAKRRDLLTSYFPPEIIGYDENEEPIYSESSTGFYFTNNSNSQSFFYLTQIQPAELSTLTSPWFVPVFVGGMASGQMPRVFTAIKTAQIGGSSASVQWSYLSSSWQIIITKANSSTSVTTTGQIGFLSSVQTTTIWASESVGNTTAFLGPLYPLTFLSMNEVSVTLQSSVMSPETSQSSAVFFGHSGRHGSTSYADASFSSGFASTAYSLGSGSAWQAVTYPDSSLLAYKNKQAVSLSTASITLLSGYTARFPTTARNAKWNEAGRGDAVLVLE